MGQRNASTPDVGTADEGASAFPPPPDLGWYPEDAQWCERLGIDLPQASKSEISKPRTREPADDDWDSTLLSSNMPGAGTSVARPVYVLHNASNGQEVTIKDTTLLGRKPSLARLHGEPKVHDADVATLVDSTRTVSRNHALIEYSPSNEAMIKDLGSLNGTYIIDGDDETMVEEGSEARLDDGMTLRIGDEFYEVRLAN